MTASFLQKLDAAARANDSWLCVGLDPDPRLAPELFRGAASVDWIVDFNRGIVEATRGLVCCYKPQSAFYEQFGAEGWAALKETIRLIGPDIPVLLDAKRGDVGNTATAYARAAFEELTADAVTVNPYMGGDSLAPFFAYRDKGIFVLCKTSNDDSGDLQDLEVATPDGATEPLYMTVARKAQQWGGQGSPGLVVGATYPSDLARIRQAAPGLPILIPGIGAQDGDLDASVQAGMDPDVGRALFSSSRGVLYASAGDDWQEAAADEARTLRDAINSSRKSVGIRS